MASKTGADAIIVSNHGGRQLDGASSTINILPEIVDKVGKLVEVHLDGVSDQQDVVKAMCLGARHLHWKSFFVWFRCTWQRGLKL